MLPFTFDESAISRIKELDELILTFRVWGVNPRGEICIEVFDSDQREYEPFNSLEFEEHRHENITAYIPKHNGNFIHGVEIIWKDFDPEYYEENRTFNHGGFECNALNKDSTGLYFTPMEVFKICEKQLWLGHHGRVFVEGLNACNRVMRELNKERYSPEDLHTIIGSGFEAIGEFLGY